MDHLSSVFCDLGTQVSLSEADGGGAQMTPLDSPLTNLRCSPSHPTALLLVLHQLCSKRVAEPTIPDFLVTNLARLHRGLLGGGSNLKEKGIDCFPGHSHQDHMVTFKKQAAAGLS